MPSSPTPHPAIGIDFGTTNSSVAIAHPRSSGANRVQLVSFPTPTGLTESFRSILYLEQHKLPGRTQTKSFTGPTAIQHYLHTAQESHANGRLIQSLKSYLSSRTLTGTEVFGRRYTIEDLISRILTDLRHQAEQHLGQPIRHATVGRPVRFVGSDSPADDDFALTRLHAAFTHAGFTSVTFELEPIAAAYTYQSTLARDQLILIGDFGGGTSDFSLLHVGPTIRQRGRLPQDLLGNSGLGLAGDAFDARIVRHLVSPALGSDSFERSYTQAGANRYSKVRSPNLIPALPAWIYRNLERWHYLSFLKTRNVTEILKAARARAEQPEKIAALITLIEEDLGYQLHQAVQRLKFDLSHHQSAQFQFPQLRIAGSTAIEATVTRAEFESWIAEELRSIETCVDTLLTTTAISPQSIDSVFLTGGTSLVPAVRAIFESRFPNRVVTGNEFISVAQGLALRALETNSAPQT